jgi:hypothetical protein
MEYATKLQDASGYEALRRVRRLHQWRKRWGLGHGKIEISCGAAGACGPDGRRGTSQLGLGVGRDRGGRHQVGYRNGGDVAQLGAPGRGGCRCAGRGERHRPTSGTPKATQDSRLARHHTRQVGADRLWALRRARVGVLACHPLGDVAAGAYDQRDWPLDYLDRRQRRQTTQP